jgi:6-phosphogluconolactonase
MTHEHVEDDVHYVDDVPAAFADLVVRDQPRTIALSGGETARRCYEALASRGGIDWRAVTVLFGDERLVPVGHPDSNEGMAREELLDHVPVARIVSMLDLGAEAYERELEALGGIDLVHLGLGPDGHTASLFPGSDALDETDHLVVRASARVPPAHDRLTLTLPAIARARHVVFTVEGEAKRDAWSRVRAGDDVPAARVAAGRVTWLVERVLWN